LTELENPDLMINGCLIFIRNYFTPLSIRQDATAFEDMRRRLFSGNEARVGRRCGRPYV